MQYLVWMTLLGAAPQFTAALTDGSEITGELTSLSLDRVVLRTASGEQTRLAGDVVRLTAAAVGGAPAVGAYVTFHDGTRLHAVGFTAAGGRAACDLGDGVTAASPTKAIRAVRFKEQSPEIGAQWERMLKLAPKADLIVIREDQSIDYLEGVIGDVTAEAVEFALEGQKIPVKRPKVEGLVYYRPADVAVAPAPCVVVERGGSTFRTSAVSLADGRVKLRTAADVDVDLPLDRVTSVEFPAHYLSQWRPERVVVTPHVKPPPAAAALVEQFYRPRFDESLGGGPLRLADREYARGVALHGRTEVSYLLPEPFARFTALAGIDDRLRPQGSVRLVIRADDRVLFDREIAGGDAPTPLSLDLTGAARLHILVDYGADGTDAGDHLDLAEARLFK